MLLASQANPPVTAKIASIRELSSAEEAALIVVELKNIESKSDPLVDSMGMSPEEAWNARTKNAALGTQPIADGAAVIAQHIDDESSEGPLYRRIGTSEAVVITPESTTHGKVFEAIRGCDGMASGGTENQSLPPHEALLWTYRQPSLCGSAFRTVKNLCRRLNGQGSRADETSLAKTEAGAGVFTLDDAPKLVALRLLSIQLPDGGVVTANIPVPPGILGGVTSAVP